jgi:hypothetical protein
MPADPPRAGLAHDLGYGGLADGSLETVMHDPRIIWPDTLSVAANSDLYLLANQLNRDTRYQYGSDMRRPPYYLFRVRLDDGQPVLLGGP